VSVFATINDGATTVVSLKTCRMTDDKVEKEVELMGEIGAGSIASNSNETLPIDEFDPDEN
jgi:hypothetical protein